MPPQIKTFFTDLGLAKFPQCSPISSSSTDNFGNSIILFHLTFSVSLPCSFENGDCDKFAKKLGNLDSSQWIVEEVSVRKSFGQKYRVLADVSYNAALPSINDCFKQAEDLIKTALCVAPPVSAKRPLEAEKCSNEKRNMSFGRISIQEQRKSVSNTVANTNPVPYRILRDVEIRATNGSKTDVVKSREDGNLYVLKVPGKFTIVSHFQHEIEIAHFIQSLKNSQFVQFVKIDRNSILMEYCRNKDALSYFSTILSKKQHGLYIDELNRFAKAAISAISALHSHGIIHSDIKPENFFVRANREFVLGDFGSAYIEDKENAFSGTPEYASPALRRFLKLDLDLVNITNMEMPLSKSGDCSLPKSVPSMPSSADINEAESPLIIDRQIDWHALGVSLWQLGQSYVNDKSYVFEENPLLSTVAICYQILHWPSELDSLKNIIPNLLSSEFTVTGM